MRMRELPLTVNGVTLLLYRSRTHPQPKATTGIAPYRDGETGTRDSYPSWQALPLVEQRRAQLL